MRSGNNSRHAGRWQTASRIYAVGVEHEGGVVVRVIVRPQSRPAIVLAARRHRGLVERIDRGAIPGNERDVDRIADAAFAADPEIRIAADAETGGGASISLAATSITSA